MGAILTLVLAMVAVAFFTLMERKVLGYIHVRKGPNKPGPAGLLVPFADAVKLFLKEMSYPLLSNKTLFNVVCVVIMLVPMLLWVGFPLAASHSAHKILVIYILAVASVGVYGTLGAGWSSNSKYSMLGAIRAVAQTISYEVSMTIIVLGAVMFMFLDLSQDKQVVVMTWMVTVFLMFAVSVLAEANRSPFDFAEGESELVSGFNTEYSSVLFVMVFLAEYMSIIFMSALCGMLFMASEFYELVVMSLLIGFFYIWSRGTLPRFRYDQLMYLAWKSFLPVSLVLLCLVTVLFSGTSLWKPASNDAKILFTSIYGCVSAAVAAVLVALSFITFKTVVDKEKASPFECGFDPSGVTRLPFCMKFFMVSVIFLVFDIEVALILPMLFSGLTVLSFLFILVAGALYEWGYGGLDWLV